MTVQQCAQFCNAPNKEHEEAVNIMYCYLLKKKSHGIILKPDRTKVIECYVDDN